MKPPHEIDGSYGEGGGQVLRSSLTLSALTGRPIHIKKIRAGRSKSGLAPQHLTSVHALAQICYAEVHGAALGSMELFFNPRSKPLGGNYSFNVAEVTKGGSAGSVTLLFQTLLVPLAFSNATSHVSLKGGTHVPWSPPFDYLTNVYLPTLALMGFKAECRLDTMGFYPTGGGQLTGDIYPLSGFSAGETSEKEPTDRTDTHNGTESTRSVLPLTLTERGDPKHVWGTATASNLPSHIAQRMANRAHSLLRSAGLKAEIKPKRERGAGPGAYIFLVVEYENCFAGFSALGKKGKSSEQVAEEACQALLMHHESAAPVEPHLADQLLLPAALAGDRSEFQTSGISNHLLTNAYIIEQFIPAKIDISANEGEPGTVVIEGCKKL